MRADRVMARGALQLPQTSVPVPLKSNTALPCGDGGSNTSDYYSLRLTPTHLVFINLNPESDWCAIVHEIL